MERSIGIIEKKLAQIKLPENDEEKKEVFRVMGNIRKIFAVVMLVGVRCPKVAALFDHDTRAPFLYLLPAVEALKTDAITGDGIPQCTAVIRKQLIHVMYTLKAVGYWVEGKNLESENYDVGEFMQIIRRSCETSDLVVDVECDGGIHSRFHDGTVAMILINCARNARKHGGASKMLIKCVKNCENVMIEILDNGCGVNDDLNENIFDWGVTGSTDGTGTGIGLADAHARMAQMGGTISFEHHGGLPNRRGGKGAKFILTLPLTQDAK